MKYIIVITVITIITVITPKIIHATNMNSNQYRIQFGTIDMGGNRVDNTDY